MRVRPPVGSALGPWKRGRNAALDGIRLFLARCALGFGLGLRDVIVGFDDLGQIICDDHFFRDVGTQVGFVGRPGRRRRAC